MDCRMANRLVRHCRQYVRGLDATAFDFFNIKRVYAIDKGAIPFVPGIEIRTEAAVNEDVDDVSESHKQIEVKTLHEQRQDVLRSDSFETAG